jgi:chromosomal replication initiator protein
MPNQHEQLWSRCLSVIKDNLSESLFTTWFAPIVALQYENNIIVLQVPSQFFVEFIEERYIDLLRKTLYRVIGVGTRLEYRVLIDKSNGKGTQIPSVNEKLKPMTVQNM